MTRLKKLALAGLTALALAAGAVAAPPAAQVAGDPSQWGIESLAKKGSFDITESAPPEELVAKVNEYEGQHRVALTRHVNEYEGQHRVALNFAKVKVDAA